MPTEWITPDGVTLSLDQDPRWALQNMSGHGAPDTDLLTAGTPDRDERQALHAAAQPRLISLTLRIQGDTLAAYETNRAALAAAFAPWRDAVTRARPGILALTLADGRRRSLRAFPRQGLAWASGRQRGSRTVESVLLEAPDPFWYAPVPLTGALTILGPGNLRFNALDELGFPAAFGADTPSVVATITNPGTVRTFPVFTVAGPTVNPSFRLGVSGHTIAFALTVPTGLTLRLTAGAQPDGSADTPRALLIDDLGGESNVLGALRSGSRFWALGPGAYTVIVSQDSPAAGTVVSYQFFQREVAV